MSHSSKTISRICALALVATGTLTAPALADFVGVSRCNQAGGSSAPVLHFVSGSQRFTVETGQGGLTSNDVMNERRALSWAASSGLFPEGTVYGNYAGYICGMQYADADPDPEPAPAREPDPVPAAEEPPVCEICD